MNVHSVRRGQILDAATTVFAARGFHRATVRDVARAAGVADGTIYNYFESKPALLLGILDRLNETERRGDDLARSLDMDLRTFMTSYFRQRMTTLTQDGLEAFRVLLPEVLADPQLRERYLTQIVEPTFALAEDVGAQWVQQGKARPLNMPLVLRAVSATFLGLLILRLLGDPQVEAHWDELPELLTTLMIDGLDRREGGGHDPAQ
ncbi:MAG: TetR/AcrR family transcriptional regulator [Egibacteraceae bacterium]